MRLTTCLCWVVAAAIQPACLVALVISADRFVSYTSARQDIAKVQFRSWIRALNACEKDVGEFPTTEQGLAALRSNSGVRGWNGPYVRKDIDADPWGRPYIYRSDRRDFEILSLGLDGKPGGKYANADVSSRRLNAPRYRMNYDWSAIGVLSAAGFFGYPFLPLLLRRLNSRWPARRS
jgi:general secretion pathway protein G